MHRSNLVPNLYLVPVVLAMTLAANTLTSASDPTKPVDAAPPACPTTALSQADVAAIDTNPNARFAYEYASQKLDLPRLAIAAIVGTALYQEKAEPKPAQPGHYGMFGSANQQWLQTYYYKGHRASDEQAIILQIDMLDSDLRAAENPRRQLNSTGTTETFTKAFVSRFVDSATPCLASRVAVAQVVDRLYS